MEHLQVEKWLYLHTIWSAVKPASQNVAAFDLVDYVTQNGHRSETITGTKVAAVA